MQGYLGAKHPYRHGLKCYLCEIVGYDPERSVPVEVCATVCVGPGTLRFWATDDQHAILQARLWFSTQITIGFMSRKAGHQYCDDSSKCKCTEQFRSERSRLWDICGKITNPQAWF
jgi:hypothetical protein